MTTTTTTTSTTSTTTTTTMTRTIQRPRQRKRERSRNESYSVSRHDLDQANLDRRRTTTRNTKRWRRRRRLTTPPFHVDVSSRTSFYNVSSFLVVVVICAFQSHVCDCYWIGNVIAPSRIVHRRKSRQRVLASTSMTLSHSSSVVSNSSPSATVLHSQNLSPPDDGGDGSSNRESRRRERRGGKISSPRNSSRKSTLSYPSLSKKKNRSNIKKQRQQRLAVSSGLSALSSLPPPDADLFLSRQNEQISSPSSATPSSSSSSSGSRRQELAPVSSLLPPPIQRGSKRNVRSIENNDYDDDINLNADGGDNLQLSSWADDLMVPSKNSSSKKASKVTSSSLKETLPSIADLFPPPDLLSQVTVVTSGWHDGKNPNDNSVKSERQKVREIVSSSLIFDGLPGYDNNVQPPAPTLEGTIPIEDLFFNPYRSTRTGRDSGDEVNNLRDDGDVEEGDDEELPFSAEQSDELSTYHKRQNARDNAPASRDEKETMQAPSRRPRRQLSPPRPRKKAVRRGLEMLVDGVPISADPPQRAIELYYQYNRTVDWQKVITTNSRDFGPAKHYQSVDLLSKEELGLFCEYFVDSTLRWNVCPKDLRGLARVFSSKTERPSSTGRPGSGDRGLPFSEWSPDEQKSVLSSIVQMNLEMLEASKAKNSLGRGTGRGFGKSAKEEPAPVSSANLPVSPREIAEGLDIEWNKSTERLLTRLITATDETTLESVFKELLSMKNSPSKDLEKSSSRQGTIADLELPSALSNENKSVTFEFVFTIDISKQELESFDLDGHQPIFERVLVKGLKDTTDYTNFEILFSHLKLADNGDGTTMVFADFDVVLQESSESTLLNSSSARKKLERIGASLSNAIDEGGASRAWSKAAKNEMAWPEDLRNKIAQEFLLDGMEDEDEEDEDDGGVDEDGATHLSEDLTFVQADDSTLKVPSSSVATIDSDEGAILSLMKDLDNERVHLDERVVSNDAVGHSSDIFFGGGDDGVFPNYDAGNVQNAPFSGKLGPRLVDAAIERAKQRHPRVIAIGDVHGCIDELQELLRECDYRPGDLVVFLGDLVSKGPDSLSVVQMAREIGAIGVRGNHDYEVIRWAQAIKSGIDPPQSRSDHYRIATKLSKADLKWMYSLPWYIHSHDLEALFVHAGFVSGIRLVKQNPRLMMNMRSILPDGTVTSKFFNNWPWARLWDGPQTVLFGHDADRGLQQYEHAMGLDTGCCYGGRLTACILPEKRLVSVPAKREYFQYRRKHYD